MYFLMFLTTTIAVYIATFKKDFNEEDIGKAMLALIVIAILTLTVSILSSI